MIKINISHYFCGSRLSNINWTFHHGNLLHSRWVDQILWVWRLDLLSILMLIILLIIVWKLSLLINSETSAVRNFMVRWHLHRWIIVTHGMLLLLIGELLLVSLLILVKLRLKLRRHSTLGTEIASTDEFLLLRIICYSYTVYINFFASSSRWVIL